MQHFLTVDMCTQPASPPPLLFLAVITSFVLVALVSHQLKGEASEREDCCQLQSSWSSRAKGHRFKSHLSRTIDVHHLSWLAAGPNNESLIGKGWHAGSLIWGSQRGSLKVTKPKGSSSHEWVRGSQVHITHSAVGTRAGMADRCCSSECVQSRLIVTVCA